MYVIQKEITVKILLVYPTYPMTYWGFHYALKFISKKASLPPLGLLTVASLLPEEWEIRLVDMNTKKLKDDDIRWADFVFVSAMVIQRESADSVIERCKKLRAPVVAGGPLFTTEHESYDNVDHLVLGEGETTVPLLVQDLKDGRPRHIYRCEQYPDMAQTPAPKWELLKMKNYASMCLQYSRGCPFNCEFCNITSLFGRVVRTKNSGQVLAELDGLYRSGWRGSVFFVDDNFIGNRKKLKNEILPDLADWMKNRSFPFTFYTEVSVDLADDTELMELMTCAGFDSVFVGIETPNEESLKECNKVQNRNRDLMESVRIMQKAGLQVQGGFIVGFDSDNVTVFHKIIRFIQDSGIVTAMVGLLNAPKGTLLYKRLKNEGRIVKEFTGDNTNYTMNFIPKMNMDDLLKGYHRIVETIYSPKVYYERVLNFLKNYKPFKRGKTSRKIGLSYINALFKSMLVLGVLGRERLYYWKIFIWSLFKKPRVFPLAITLSIYGFHFRKVFKRA